MNTEDDTFRILRRTPRDQVIKVLQNMSKQEWNRFALDDSLIVEFLKSFGWTQDDWLTEIILHVHDIVQL